MERKTKKSNKRRALFILFWAFLVMAICCGSSYAYIKLNTTFDNENVVDTGCLKIDLIERENINLTGAFPVSDATGMNSKPYTFSITNSCSLSAKYVLSLNLIDNTDSSSAPSVKVAMNGDYTIAPRLVSELRENTLNDKPSNVNNSYVLNSGILDVGETRKYDLRLWIDLDATSLDEFTSNVMISATVNEE